MALRSLSGGDQERLNQIPRVPNSSGGSSKFKWRPTPGALIAGLGIGVIEALSAYLIGAVYQDVVVYSLFLLVLWVRPQGLLGTN